MDQSNITTRDKIDILFKEYDTLREEIIHRTNNGFGLIAVASAALAWVLSRPYDFKVLLMLSLLAIITFGVNYFCMIQIRRCASRLRQLETEINALAGCQLLQWESKWGMGATGHQFKDKMPSP